MVVVVVAIAWAFLAFLAFAVAELFAKLKIAFEVESSRPMAKKEKRNETKQETRKERKLF